MVTRPLSYRSRPNSVQSSRNGTQPFRSLRRRESSVTFYTEECHDMKHPTLQVRYTNGADKTTPYSRTSRIVTRRTLERGHTILYTKATPNLEAAFFVSGSVRSDLEFQNSSLERDVVHKSFSTERLPTRLGLYVFQRTRRLD